MKQSEKKQADQEKTLKKKNDELEEKDLEVERHSTKSKKLAELNEELR